MKKIHKILTHHWQISLYLLIFSILFSIKIIHNPLPFFDWDESIYAQVGKEMTNNATLVPLWQGKSWLDKPPLVPLFYGLVMISTSFIQPEVSTRLATLYLSILALGLVYILYFRVIKEQWLTTFVVIITSISSIFLQRAQVLNVDIFLLIGWIGYVLFYRKFWISLIFLSCAVYSKSLIGFYPVVIIGVYHLYRLFTKQINLKALFQEYTKLFFHILILSIWYFGMYLRFGNDFLYQHFYESHIKRVTSSIESHFGQRTFYIDLLFIEYGKYIWWSVLGFALLIYQWARKYLSDKKLLYALFIVPWFIFLNLTKTKIFWYGHPYMPQFAFLMIYPLCTLKKARLIYIAIIIISVTVILQQYFFTSNVLNNFYSSNDPHHKIAKTANHYCDELNVVIEPEGRVAYQTLKNMDLLISTSRWWGNHPSMVYYFHKKLNFIYSLENLTSKLNQAKPNNCYSINKNDPEGILIINQYSNTVYYSSDPLILYTISP